MNNITSVLLQLGEVLFHPVASPWILTIARCVIFMTTAMTVRRVSKVTWLRWGVGLNALAFGLQTLADIAYGGARTPWTLYSAVVSFAIMMTYIGVNQMMIRGARLRRERDAARAELKALRGF
jgi:hypothetical protein